MAHVWASERRRRVIHRAIPVFGVLAAVSLAAGIAAGRLGGSDEEEAAERFAAAWARSDYDAMFNELTPAARERTSRRRFERAYEDAKATATATRLEAGEVKKDGDAVRIPLTVTTRIFGPIREEVSLPVRDGGIDWQPHAVFPGLGPGARLSRRTEAPARAEIVSRDGKTIVEGPIEARTSPLGAAGANIAGQVGPPESDDERDFLEVRGFARDHPLGRTGLERILELQVAGTPGGTLLAGGRVLATSRPKAAAEVRTTLDTRVQTAAVQAIGTRLGGIAALDPQTAEVRALAGIAFSAPQPPGSTFKLVTTTAALEEKLVTPRTNFPVQTEAVIDGVDLENANRESCGGSFANSFAHSCNSVFGPLGVRLGAEKLVDAAERYGFNKQPSIPGAKASTLPRPEEIDSPLAVASTAIGQGKVLTTPLQMATIAQTIAADGIRHEPTLVPGEAANPPVRVTTKRVARTLERLMIGVVEYGTGVAASLKPVRVAGKTGTAELETTQPREGAEPAPDESPEPAGSDTDAWFAAYAPARRPKLAVGVLFVRAGAGGETAAPAAKQVLAAGL